MEARKLSDGSVVMIITRDDANAMLEAGDKLCIVPESHLKKISEESALAAVAKFAEEMMPLLSQKEVAENLGVSEPTVSSLGNKGKLDVIWVGGRKMYTRHGVQRYKKEAVRPL